MEEQLDRIATAFEKIADSLEKITLDGIPLHAEIERIGSIHAELEYVPPLLVKLGSFERAHKVELSNCTDD